MARAERMMIWHVVHGSSTTKRLLRLGLKNVMYSAWSYRGRARVPEVQLGTIRASGGRIFLDSGALSALRRRPAALDWLDRQEDIAALAREIGADIVSHLDIPMERRGLANGHLSRNRALWITIRNAVDFMDLDVGGAPKVYVIQGWTLEEYERCIRAFYDHGIPDAPNGLGLGTCCMRKETRGLWQIAEHVRARTNGFWLHAFGVGDLTKLPRLAEIGYNSVDEGNTVRAIIYHKKRLPALVETYRGFDA